MSRSTSGYLSARALAILRVAFTVAAALAALPPAAGAASTAKIGFFNIQSGKGEQGLAGRAAPFIESTNCIDTTTPLNAWGVGFVQRELTAKLANDPSVIALGLAEAWICGTPENVRKALNWKAHTGELNGLGIVARHGFAGAATFFKLDTSLSTNAEPRYIVHAPVCLDAACSRSFDVFAIHAYGVGPSGDDSLVRQMEQAVAFMAEKAGTRPRAILGDFNVNEEMGSPCATRLFPPRILDVLRTRGYIDAWRALHGDEPGFTGMLNRIGCSVPEGGPYQRIDYAWSLDAAPLTMTRFGVVPAGDASPSDHYGILAEYPVDGVPPGPDTTGPVVSIAAPVENATIAGTVAVAVNATDPSGVAEVAFLADGAPLGSDTIPPFSTSWNTAALTNGIHMLQARATDTVGNVTLSSMRTVIVSNPVAPPPDGTTSTGDVVLHGAAATVAGLWQIVADASAASGRRLYNADHSATKAAAASDAPASYADLQFYAEKGKAYRLWMRGRADANSWANDSAFVQFSDAIDAAGAPIWRIGTTNATTVQIEAGTNAGLAGWGWASNAYGGLGPLLSFSTTGTHTIRLQIREDGMSVDQIVLSAATYLTSSPGAAKNDTVILPMQTVAPTGPPPPPPGGTVVRHATDATALHGTWRVVADATGADGVRIEHPDAGAPKVATPLAAPLDYFEMTFTAEAGRAYRFWLRGRAQNDGYVNDSVYVQFSGSVTATGAVTNRIGTTEALAIVLEDCSGCGLSGWGWQDNGYGVNVLGATIYFEASGTQRMRVQGREDGMSIDQVVLSPDTYLTASPGATKQDSVILPRTP